VLLHGSGGNGVVASSQVFCEFAFVLLHKMRPTPPTAEVIAALDSLSDIRLIPTDRDLILRAIEARERYGLHFWDGMIVAAAERGGCGQIWSEDMNAGQRYFGVVVENPFV
jgi:predicted nucleic acid-binding protein